MPRITQDRMIALINAAGKSIERSKALNAELIDLRDNEIRDITEQAQATNLSPEQSQILDQFISLIDEFIDRIQRTYDVEAMMLVAAERAHFNTHYESNILAKKAMSRLRAKKRPPAKALEKFDPMATARKVHEKMLEMWSLGQDPIPEIALPNYLDYLGIVVREDQEQVMMDLVSGGFIKLDEKGDIIPQIPDKDNPTSYREQIESLVDIHQEITAPSTGGTLPDRIIQLKQKV